MIGDKYRLLVPCLNNPKGAIGVVFNEYRDFDVDNERGIQVIFQNGEFDGFSVEEQFLFLEYIGHDFEKENYVFENVYKVSLDFRRGYWDESFIFT